MGPARFSGNAGTFEIMGETEGEKERGTLRGRINLTALAPLVGPWLEALSGAMDFDLAVAGAGPVGGERPLLTGNVTHRVAGLGATSGRAVRRAVPRRSDSIFPATVFRRGTSLQSWEAGPFTWAGGLVLPATGGARLALDLRGDLDARLVKDLAPAMVRRAEGTALLNAHIAGPVANPKIKVRVDLPRRIEFAVPALGPDRIDLVGGPIEWDGRAVTIRSIEVDVGPKLRVLVGADAIPGYSSVSIAGLR